MGPARLFGILGFMLVIALTSIRLAADTAIPLPRPTQLEPAVRFWVWVYTEIDSQSGLIHDADNLSVVYETVRFTEDLTGRQRQKRVDAIKKRYAAILDRLAKHVQGPLGEEERRVQALWSTSTSRERFRRAAKSLRYQRGQSDRFRAGLIRSGVWRDHIVSTLAKRGLPTELVALPHVESSYNPRAYSRVGAAGLWQFTRGTGRRFLRIDHIVDERMDPYEATLAAAELLTQNHRVLGSWPLAITAYNHGVSGMKRAVRDLQTTDISEIVTRYRSPSFGFASRNFYVAFLAAVEIDQNAERYFGPLQMERPRNFERVVLPDFMPIKVVTNALGVDPEQLRISNPALRHSVWDGEKYLPRGFELKLRPNSRRGSAITALAEVPTRWRYRSQRPDVEYRVRPGNTLSGIAKRFGVSVRRLMNINGLSNRHFVRVGQVLKLPAEKGQKTAPRPQLAQSTPGTPPANGRYRVRPGDTLSGIATRFGMPANELLALNALTDPHRIQAGHVLTLASPASVITAVVAQAEAESKEGVNATEVIDAADFQDGIVDAPPLAEPAPVVDSPPSLTDDATIAASKPVEIAADPSDYRVAADATIEVQAAETLGHYADWLGIATNRLRRLNGLRFGERLVVGRRLRLDLAVSAETFQRRRIAYHRSLQQAFFNRYRIAGTRTHETRSGDSLWVLSQRRYAVPFWLLRQYNPDLDFSTLRPGTEVTIPKLQTRPPATVPAEPLG